ncbi:MAG: hypothetical protein HDT28_00050 [Clostridiales bacterium]|nr:hypothetical protein [Clostridiales bacterium]
MKKRTLVSISLAAVLAACPIALTGCSGDHYSSISFDAQDTSHIVTSQGGSAVAYGNYVYFINGTRGYDDTDGNANVWNKTVKGALYRAELNGKTAEDKNTGLNTFMPELDDKGYEFKFTAGEDYFGEPKDIIDNAKIAPKTIGTSGYATGGIFIYDNAVFFASPNNEKNSTGTVQTTSTDFFMMPLNGGSPKKIYTTSEKVDTSSAAYAFYKHDGFVYLVVNEDGTIVSVKINADKAKVYDPVAYEVEATSVYFPVRDTYYTGIANNTPEDFIYFVRAVTDDDTQRAGTVIEAMRPDGSDNFVVSMTGNTETIEGVRDGILFYRTADGAGNTVLAYDNLHNKLMEYSAAYKAEQEKAEEPNSNISGRFPTFISSDFTSVYPFRADTKSNVVYFVAQTSSALVLYTNSNSTPRLGVISATAGTPQFIQGNYLYFAGSSNDFYRAPLFSNLDGYGEAQLLAEETTSAGISCDYAAGYFTYFAKVDDWADGYTYFYKVDGAEGMEAQFVGTIAEFDQPTEEEIKNILEGNDTEDDSTEE